MADSLGGDRAAGIAAAAIVAGAGLAMVAGLISGLALDFPTVDVRFRIKTIALSSSSAAFFGSVLTGAFVVGVALLLALALANSAPLATAAVVRQAATILAGLLAIATAAALVVDLILLSDRTVFSEEINRASVSTIALADLVSLIVVATAALMGAKGTRGES